MMIKIAQVRADQNLMYLIQSVTKDSTGDILTYFYNLAMQIAEQCKDKYPDKRINKTLAWHYKDTQIPYSMEMWTSPFDIDDMVRSVYVGIRFPTKRCVIDMTEAVNRMVECGLNLEGSEPLPNFEKPFTRVPAGFRKFIHK